MGKVLELFGFSSSQNDESNFKKQVNAQYCPFLGRKCIKVRKSQPDISIGTCSVVYGKEERPIAICPFRFLERRQIFFDCIHLLSVHEPGNELHVIPEIAIPGGSVDYFLVSAKGSKVKDFVGLEIQTLDTTGTVWPARNKWLNDVGIKSFIDNQEANKTFGMNWKMTAKTILIQLHHKIKTFEHLNKHLVLAIQDCLLDYLKAQFQFSHLHNARIGDPAHIHSYVLDVNNVAKIELEHRLSTDTDGISICLGLQAEPKLEMISIINQLESKISEDTLLKM